MKIGNPNREGHYTPEISVWKRAVAYLREVFGRETASGTLIPELDGLRCVAIVSVLWHHIAGWVEMKYVGLGPGSLSNLILPLLRHGYVGVQLFFTISGFILAMPFARHWLWGRPKPTYKAYLLRRVSRLEPPYVINIAIWVLVLCLVGVLGADNLKAPNEWSFVGHVVASICYLHNVIYGHASVINPVAWSLEIEAQFYLIAPLLCYVFFLPSKVVRRGLLIAAIVICALAQKALPQSSTPLHGLSLLYHLHYFLVGYLLLDFYLTDWRGKPGSTWADAVGIVGWVAVGAVVIVPWHADVTLPVAIFVAYVGAFYGHTTRRILGWWPISLVGGMCYTIYLFHYLILSALGRFLKRTVALGSFDTTLITYLMLMSVLIITLCGVLFVTVEKPFMRRGWPRIWMGWLERVLSREAAHVRRVVSTPVHGADADSE